MLLHHDKDLSFISNILKCYQQIMTELKHGACYFLPSDHAVYWLITKIAMLSSNPSTEVFPKYVITKPISVYYFCLADSLNLTNNRVEGGICETRALILGKFCGPFWGCSFGWCNSFWKEICSYIFRRIVVAHLFQESGFSTMHGTSRACIHHIFYCCVGPLFSLT